MKRRLIYLSVMVAVVLLLARSPAISAEWSGVDEKVIEKFAEQAGRPPSEPLINTDQGDLLLFVFLIAGAVGGFVAGYSYRMLFGERGRVDGKRHHV
jgi:cobalt/nickel transport system permease protein